MITVKIDRAKETKKNPMTHPPLKAALNPFLKHSASVFPVAVKKVTLKFVLVAMYIPMYPEIILVSAPSKNEAVV